MSIGVPPPRLGTYWGMGTFTGQPMVFGLFALAYAALLVDSIIQQLPTGSITILVVASGSMSYCWFGPRITVRKDEVEFHSWFSSLTVPRSQVVDAVSRISPRAVVYFHGARLPELRTSDGKSILLPMLPSKDRCQSDRPRRLLRGREDLLWFAVEPANS